MARWESTLVAVFLGIAAPLTLLVVVWWLTAAIAIYGVFPLPESFIVAGALTGLGAGIILDLFLLRRWVKRFYTVDGRFMALLYLVWSVMALALFMGLPVGVLLLGTGAGVYVGRKERHGQGDRAAFERSARAVALFTAGVIGVESLLMGILALQERFTMSWLLSVIGLGAVVGNGWMEGAFVAGSCCAIAAAQYALTRCAAIGAFRAAAVA